MRWWVVLLVGLAACGRIAFDPLDDGGGDAVGARALAIGAGTGFTCALREDRSMWCWGKNSSGQLGDGTVISRTAAARVDLPEEVAQIIVGTHTVCALTVSGGLWCWGQNPLSVLVPGPDPLLVPTHVRDGVTAAGSQRVDTCLIAGGAVACFGFFTVGDFGIDNVEVAVGNRHACARKLDGSVWCAGQGFSGELGDAGATATSFDPVRIPGVATAVALSIDGAWSCARLADDTAMCWGQGFAGTGPPTVTVPVSIGRALEIATGGGATCARTGDVTACWGINRNGQLGDRTTLTAELAHPSALASGLHGLSIGGDHACGIDDDQRVYCWGSNVFGQLGYASVATATTATPIADLVALQIAASWFGNHVCAIVAGGEVWCWGLNDVLELANGTAVNATAPTRAVNLTGSYDQITVGDAHSCARRSDLTIWCWGANTGGQLGDGTTTNPSVPVSPPINSVMRVVAGVTSTCAIRTDGSLYCWGQNNRGQLGVGDQITRTTPKQVTLPPVTDVAIGLSHACAVTVAGEVWCWGANSLAQLGDGTNVSTTTPIRIVTGMAIMEVVVGGTHSCARDGAGAVLCWGNAIDGQAGHAIPPTVDPVPIQVLPGGSASSLTTALVGTCVAAPPGPARCTGSVIGLPTTFAFTPRPELGSPSQLVTTSGTLCARDGAGVVTCVGDNTFGTLGIGEAAFSLVRVPQLVGL